MKRTVQFLLIAAIGGVLISCSGASKNTVRMNATEAKATASAALGDLSMASLVMGPTALTSQSVQAAGKLGLSTQTAGVLEGLGMNLAQAVTVGCDISVIPGGADKDFDLTPDKASVSVQNCSYKDDNNTPGDTSDDIGYSFEGSVTLEDTDDNRANSGFKLTLSGWKEAASKGAKSLERALDGSYTLNIPAGAASYTVGKGYTAAQTYKDGTQTDALNVQFGLDQTYTPDSVGLFKKAGSYAVDKTKPGTLNLTHNGKAYAWSGYTDPALHFTSSCKAKTKEGVRIPFDSGSAHYTYINPDSASSSLVISFTACGSYTVTLDGQAVQ